MSVTPRIEKSRKSNEEPKYSIIVTDGKADGGAMGIPKVLDRKPEAIKRLKQLGATDALIDQAFRELRLRVKRRALIAHSAAGAQ